jgi:hypothetical protein
LIFETVKTKAFNPELLDLIKNDKEYIIFYGGSPLVTKKGELFKHTDQRLLKKIITDIQIRRCIDCDGITSYRLLEFQLDYIDKRVDFISEDFNRISDCDDLILLKTGRIPRTASSPDYLSLESNNDEDPLFNTIFWGFSSVIMNLNSFITENIQQIDSEIEDDHPFILLLKQHYQLMSNEMRSAVHLLSYINKAGIVLPLLFVLNRITASEYAKGMLSIQFRNQSEYKEDQDQDDKFPYEPDTFSGLTPQEIYSTYFNSAVEVGDYLALVNIIGVKQPVLLDLITKGESGELEFKSTFRWDLKAGKTNPAVERASLKTISAFLNSSGGILLIGVRDDGSIEGIESDRFANEDKFLLHLWTLIRTSLGRDVSPFIQTLLEKKDEKTICIVRCSKSPKPVFLKQPGFNEEFFIRVGPSSNALEISEALRYVSVHFKEKVNG